MSFIKYTGGKSRVYPVIRSYFPETSECSLYVEPFVGAGAVALLSRFPNAILSDMNPNLMACYVSIRDNLKQLVSLLSIEQKIFDTILSTYTHGDTLTDEQIRENNIARIYYNTRYTAIQDFYNKLKMRTCKDFYETSLSVKTHIACAFIVLNKTCHNGFYRENESGEFDVPPGKYHKVTLFKQSLLESISDYLNGSGVTIECKDAFTLISELPYTSSGFIYCEPPASKRVDANIKLANTLAKVKSRGYKCAVSVSHRKVAKCYHEFNRIDELPAKHELYVLD